MSCTSLASAHQPLLPLSSVKQGKHSRRNSAFGVMGLGQEQPGGNPLARGCYCHIVYLRGQGQENPACPQTAQKEGHIQALWCHTAPALPIVSLRHSRGCSRSLGSPTAPRAGSASDEQFQSLNSKLTHGLCPPAPSPPCPGPRLLDAGRGADGVCRTQTRQVLWYKQPVPIHTFLF